LKNFESIIVFFLNLGNARLGEYETALKFLDAILHIQPGNHQAKNLKDEITRRMTREGCMSIFVFENKK
jgi:fission 1 protein